MKNHILAVMIFFAAAVSVSAQESAAFLKLGTGARALALGGAYTAAADDVDALYWNPGALALMDKTELGATHASLFSGDTYDSVSIAVPLGMKRSKKRTKMFTQGGRWNTTAVHGEESPRGVLGLGVTRLGQGGLQGRDANRNTTGNFTSSDMAFTVAYARHMTGGLYAGLAVKRIQSRIANNSAGATAVDFGALYRFQGMRGLRLGGAIRNLGSGLKFGSQTNQLPLTFSAGAAFEPLKRMLILGEVQHRPYANRTSMSLGTEYALLPSLAVRAGYLHHEIAKDETSSLIGSFGGGIGLRWARFTVDYSIAPFGALGTLQSASLKTQF